MKSELKKQAQDLRRQGYLFAEIAVKLNISRSTAQIWTHTLEFTEAERKLLQQRKTQLQNSKMANLAASKRAFHIERQRVLIERARTIVRNTAFTTTDSKSVLCALLYWCEGTKDVSSGIKFTNADPILVRKFLSLLRTSFEIDERKFRVLLHLHEYHDQAKQLSYWSGITSIPSRQFHKTYTKPHTAKNKHADYPGCASVRYLDASIGKLLKMIYSEYGQTL